MPSARSGTRSCTPRPQRQPPTRRDRTAAAAPEGVPTRAPISMDPPRTVGHFGGIFRSRACGSPLHTGVPQATFIMAPFSRCDLGRERAAGGVVGTGATRRGQAGIIDVARRAGVSPSTVSRSLRGSAKVSAQTRDRVLRAAAELRYVPSPAASRLASGRTGAIGVVVPFAYRWFFTEVLTGLEGPLREVGYDVLLYNVGDPAGGSSSSRRCRCAAGWTRSSPSPPRSARPSGRRCTRSGCRWRWSAGTCPASPGSASTTRPAPRPRSGTCCCSATGTSR